MSLPRASRTLPLWPTEKSCATCHVVKPLSEFHKNRVRTDGYERMCGECRGAYQRYRKSIGGSTRLQEERILAVQGLRRCRRCKVVKPHAAFDKHKIFAVGRRAQCKECRAAQHVANIAIENERCRYYYFKTRDRWLAYGRAHYDKDKVMAQTRAYRAKHPHMQTAARNKYRSLRRKVPGTFTQADYALLLEVQRGMCAYCDHPMVNPVIEHMTPLSRGGTNGLENICLACAACNNRKHLKTAGEYFAQLIRPMPRQAG